MSSASRFRVIPDPPVAGNPADVVYVGPASEVVYQVDGGQEVRVTPDKNGRFRIKSVPSGDELMFDDRLGFPGYLHCEIQNLG